MATPNRTTRAGAFALACMTAASVAAAATPEPAGAPAGSTVARLVPLPGVQQEADREIRTAQLPARRGRLRPAELPRSIERVTSGALRRQVRMRRFPVTGPFNLGQDGARFGAGRGGRSHAGQDVFGRTGSPLLAVGDGVVLEADEDGGRGNYIGLYDPEARRTYVYLHLQRPARFRAGRRVRAGEQVGELGCTGSCFGDHLHFEIRRGRGLDGPAENPLPHLLRWARDDRAPATLPPGAN